MRFMILALVVLIVVAVGFVLLLASRKPDAFGLKRSIFVSARPDAIWPLILDFRRWAAWSPWDKVDPNLRRTYSGASSGVGAAYEWEGKKAGAGRMEIVHAAPDEAGIDLVFKKPFRAHNRVTFTLAPEGDGTRVTWAMVGPTPFLAKIARVFLDMDGIVGRDFERGLAALKDEAESGRRLEVPAGSRAGA